jgi:hypothetical protein
MRGPSKRAVAYSGVSNPDGSFAAAPDRAAVLHRQLVEACIVSASTRFNGELLQAAAAAQELIAAEGAVDDERLLKLLPRGQRLKRMKVWLQSLMQLAAREAPPQVVLNGRGAARPSRCAGLAALQWRVDGCGALSEAGLPVQPVVWRLLRRQAVGANCGSATRLGNKLAHFIASSGNASAAVTDMLHGKGPTAVPLTALATPAARPPYVRVSIRSAELRDAILQATLGVDGSRLDALRQPEVMASGGLRLAVADAPKECEGVGQLWLNYEDGRSSCHHDAPEGLLICLGGRREVLLMKPEAPGGIGIPEASIRGSSMTPAFDAFDMLDKRADELAGSVCVCELMPGMAVFIPHGWWHQVRAYAGGVAVSVPVQAQRSTLTL